MKLLPGSDKIKEEVLELFALANALYVSKEHLQHLKVNPYIESSLSENGQRLIIEKLLSVAVKLRFLDDQEKILKNHDRNDSGFLSVEGQDMVKIGLRESLNKIIHHKEIHLHAGKMRTTVAEKYGSADVNALNIEPGVYESFCIYANAAGFKGKEFWQFRVDLIRLVNEILRVLYLYINEKEIE